MNYLLRENGQFLNVPVAVVVQEMVDNVISGVMFTNDPVKGDPSVIVVNMIDGLGEELVSGQRTPVEIVMKKSLGFIKKVYCHFWTYIFLAGKHVD